MKSILEEFANDNLEVLPQSCPDNARSRHFLKEADRLWDTLETLLNDREKELLDKLDDARSEMDEISATDRFIRGYRLGVLMMIDVFAGYDSLILQSKGGKTDE